MTGRHAGKAADNLAVNLAVLAGVPLGLLGLLAGIIYLAVSMRFTNLDLVIVCAFASFVWIMKFIAKWREDKRFPPVEAFCLLGPAVAVADALVPSWRWVHWAAYAIVSVLGIMLLRISAQRWRQRRTERGLTR
jgi:hypothetical protein